MCKTMRNTGVSSCLPLSAASFPVRHEAMVSPQWFCPLVNTSDWCVSLSKGQDWRASCFQAAPAFSSLMCQERQFNTRQDTKYSTPCWDSPDRDGKHTRSNLEGSLKLTELTKYITWTETRTFSLKERGRQYMKLTEDLLLLTMQHSRCSDINFVGSRVKPKQKERDLKSH